MTDEQFRGKNILTVFLALVLLSDVLVGLLAAMTWRDSLLTPAIRFILTVLICAALHSGSLIARRISILLFGLGSVIGLAVAAMTHGLFGVVIISPLAAFYLVFAIALENSTSVGAFMLYQRQKRAGQLGTSVSFNLPLTKGQTCPMCGAAVDSHSSQCPACGETRPNERAEPNYNPRGSD